MAGRRAATLPLMTMAATVSAVNAVKRFFQAIHIKCNLFD
jgi:hypothetical protein